MANKTIPDLGQVYTATDLDYLVITNSGETTTSKITRQDLLAGTDIAGGFIQGDASQSLVPYYFPTSSGTTADTTYVDKLYSVGGQIDSTDYKLLVNSEGSTITSTSTKQTIIGGDNNTIPATNQYNAVINGRNTDISGNSVQSTSIGGYNNDINGVWWGLTIGGDGNKLNGTANTYGASYSTILGGASNTITNDAYNNGNGIISSSSSDILGASTQTTIMGGQDNLIEDAERASIIGGQNHRVKGTDASNKTTYSGIFVGYDNDILGAGDYNVVVGGNANTINNSGPVGIIQASNSTITSSNYNSTILGATAASITNAGHSVVGGGYGNQISNSNCAFVSGRGNAYTGTYQDCEGGMYSTWTSTSNQAGKATMMGGGYNNTLQTTADYAVLLGGQSNTMTTAPSSFMAGSSNSVLSASTNSAIISSVLSSIDTKDRAVMIATSGRTAEYENTLHSDYQYTYNAHGTKWRQGGNVSGSFSVDLSTGSLFSFTITGNIGTIQLNNTRIGFEYEFWVYNSGSYTITSINLDGYASSVYAKGAGINPTNSGYTYYRLRIVDDGLGGKVGVLDEHLNFGAI